MALTLLPGRTLDRNQIAGIVNMTATAVPGLSPKAVSITDQDGTWLTQPDSELRSDAIAQQRLQLRETEARLLKRVNEILEPALGADNLRATVTAELDFNQIESTSEAYSKNQGADAKAAIRSTLAEAETAKLPVLVVFGANWCGDCRMLDTTFKTGPSAPLIAQLPAGKPATALAMPSPSAPMSCSSRSE